MMPCLFRSRILSAGNCESICKCNDDQSARAASLYSAAEVTIIFHDVATFSIFLFHDALPFSCRIFSAGIARHLRRQVANKRNDE
jgi:hypothetical protein